MKRSVFNQSSDLPSLPLLAAPCKLLKPQRHDSCWERYVFGRNRAIGKARRTGQGRGRLPKNSDNGEDTMSIEKKSLISSRTAAKKAIIARGVVAPRAAQSKTAPMGLKAVPMGHKAAPMAHKAAPMAHKAAPMAHKAAPMAQKALAIKAAPLAIKAAPMATKAAPMVTKAAPLKF
jgi:hypothetical protein